MRNALLIALVIFTVSGCKPGIPDDIIPPEKMSQVLYDIHITDGYTNTIPDADSAKRVAASFYKGIYNKFEIDSALYAKSMEYYHAHPDVMTELYDGITARLEKDKNVNQAYAYDAPLSRMDSLKVRDSLNTLLIIDTAKTKPELVQPSMFYKGQRNTAAPIKY